MSYTIFYRAMFIKMRDGSYIPTIESGDNNVWEADNRRRAREWCACRWTFETPEQRMKYALSEQEIMDAAQRDLDKAIERYAGQEPAFGGTPYTKEDVMRDLGFFNGIHISGRSKSSATQFLNFFRSGIRNAVTMDEIRYGVRLSWYEENKYTYVDAKDEDELAAKWKECLDKGIKTPWISIPDGPAEMAWRDVKARNHKERVRRAPEKTFVIAYNAHGCDLFAFKLTSRRLHHTAYMGWAHKYASKKTAQNAADRIEKFFNNISNVRVLEATA